MKYEQRKYSPNREFVSWPGFEIETVTAMGAAKLVEELNHLDKNMNDWAVGCHKAQAERDDLREELDVQIEAKNNALRKVTDLEALKQRLGVRTHQVSELLNVLEAAQGILARYVEPGHPMKARYALTGLLGILDDGELVSMMRNLRELIGVKDNGSDGKRYIAGFGIVTPNGAGYQPEPFTVQANQVYVNKSLVLDGIIPTTKLAAEPQGRVVNNTTNHFGPSKKLKRKNRKLKARVSELENELDELLSEIRANAERD